MKKFLSLIMALSLMTGGIFAQNTNVSDNRLIAFPGAEGGGKYVTGGRGCEVYIVDTLKDYDPETEEPIKGSLRDAVSESNRFVVFNVGGVINLKTQLRIKDVQNITIAGQTAPGNGITIYGYDTDISRSENIIIRYIRFRAGAENVSSSDALDAIWGRSMKNVIIDHISTSWSTDETMSLYRAENMTVQWSVASESLTLSGHLKGRHGYGGIWGGVNTTFHHNLIANHTSRNPRMGGGTVEKDDNEHIANFDMRNNVIYNWGFNTIYGGGRANANFINNYEKPGPGTRQEVYTRIIDAGEKNKPGQFYIDGNVIESSDEFSKDNSKGIYISEESAPFTTIADKPFEMAGTEDLELQDPETAYKEVLDKAGATYPKRDSVDARIINDVKNGTGRFANTEKENGGLAYNDFVKREKDFDKDADGIKDTWETANGLNPEDSSDSILYSENGYTNIENYVNSLVDMEYVPENPEVKITSPENNKIYSTGENVEIKVNATGKNAIDKVELYNSDKLLMTDTTAPYEFIIEKPAQGSHFISAKAYDKEGNQTQSDLIEIHINDKESKNWISKDIGKTNIKGTATDRGENALIVKGTGKIKENSDNFQFAYQLMPKDFEISAKINSITDVDVHAFSGLMVREDLSQNAKTFAVGLSWTKSISTKTKNKTTGKEDTTYSRPWSVYTVSRNEDNGQINQIGENLDSLDKAKDSGVDLIHDINFRDYENNYGYYIKLKREGDIFTSYTSPDGENWTKLSQREIKMSKLAYVGFAVDSNKVNNNLDNLNTVEFTDIKVTKNEIPKMY